MTTVGTGKYTYTLIEDWAKLPQGESFGMVSAVATDSQDRVYAFQRKDPPVLMFDRDGNLLSSWGTGVITDPHGIYIADDIVYITDRGRLGSPEVHSGGQTSAGAGTAGCSLGHRVRNCRRCGAQVGRPVQLPHRAGAGAFGGPLRL